MRPEEERNHEHEMATRIAPTLCCALYLGSLHNVSTMNQWGGQGAELSIHNSKDTNMNRSNNIDCSNNGCKTTTNTNLPVFPS
jgi:hypothetical protein